MTGSCSIEVLYAGGHRVSELVTLTWSAVIARDKGVQLNVLGKGGIERNVLLSEAVSRSLMSLRSAASSTTSNCSASARSPLRFPACR